MGTPLRYTIPVPERTRVIWVSQAAKELWAPRLARITAAWSAVERESVGQFRTACRQSVAPDELPLLSAKAAEQAMGLLVLGQQPIVGQYASRSSALAPGQPFAYNVVLAQDMAAARAFSIAHKGGDDAMMGDLLGYPPCCISFFQQAWNKERWMDTTWPMVKHLASNSETHREFENVSPTNNILLRWLGARIVPHLPCSFDCKGTQALGGAFVRLMERSYPQETCWLWDLLSSDVEWSAIKGTAEIRLSILKIAATTDPLTEPVSVRLKGSVELEAAARGNTFPWKATNAAPSIAPMVFHKVVPMVEDETLWKHNGFSSREAMNQAHQKIVDYFAAHRLSGRLLDLGCGNGHLASRLSKSSCGVEADAVRAQQARKRLVDVYEGTILDYVRETRDAHFDVALISANRLNEAPEDEKQEVLDWLSGHVKTTVVYSYETGSIVRLEYLHA